MSKHLVPTTIDEMEERNLPYRGAPEDQAVPAELRLQIELVKLQRWAKIRRAAS